MTSAQIRQKYLKFFADRGHVIIPSAPLVPENDPTTLFTSSGMQPLVPYLLGQKHPAGKRLVNSQKSFRAQDIEEVGDNRHTTFFEMLGNWSLGDYFKKEQLPWIFEFLTKELRLDPKRLSVTVFEGNSSVPKDTESIEIWKELFRKEGIEGEDRIFTYPAKKNWWSRSGEPENMPSGEPGGPDSEVFYDFGENFRTHENSIYKNEQCHPNCDCGRFLEIANSVFMQYQKQADGSLIELPQKNVDFGGGLERLTAAANDNLDIFKIDLFLPMIKRIENLSKKTYLENEKSMRIIADHTRSATMMIADQVIPGKKKQGAVLRRLINRAISEGHKLNIKDNFMEKIALAVVEEYRNVYPNLVELKDEILSSLGEEEIRFKHIIDIGSKVLEKRLELTPISSKEDSKKVLVYNLEKYNIEPDKFLSLVGRYSSLPSVSAGTVAFQAQSSYGIPLENSSVLLKNWVGENFKEEEFLTSYKQMSNFHQSLSRTASKGLFKGGLANHSETVTKLHTATHLLHAALRKILGVHVSQKGSNITAERLRFDFTHPTKLTEEERANVETWINEQITLDLPVESHETTIEEAQKEGAVAFFADRYGKQVRVYVIGNAKTGIVSREVCGGPHVTHTGELGQFRLGKEESVGTGTRRLYATLS